MDREKIVAVVRDLVQPADQALMLGLIEHESSFNTMAFRHDRNGGSYGLCQLDFPTACDRGFHGKPTDLYDAPTNIAYGYRQILWLRAFHNGMLSYDGVIAAYNEGVGTAAKGAPDSIYVEAVKAARDRWMAIGGQSAVAKTVERAQ